MVAELNFVNRIMVYEDETASNNPKQQLLNYQISIEADITNYTREDVKLTGATTHTVTLPVSPTYYAYIISDAVVSVRFNGMTGDQVVIRPATAGKKDGFLIKRGDITSLIISVGAGVTANVTVFLGS